MGDISMKKRVKNFMKKLNPLKAVIGLSQRIVVASAGLRRSRYYQPIYGRVSTRSKRESIIRWDAMKQYLPSDSFSFLDTGCEIGYFTFKASERGAVAIGVERKKKLYDLAMTIRSIQKMDRTAFFNMGIDINNVRSLPRVDVLCCLSIFHHWISEWGFDTADEIFSILCEKTTSVFFETGQPNESVDWAAKVVFMEPDIDGWISKYLASKGFSKVTSLGEYSTNRGDTRFLFFASR
jgi:SAM-dependent methyltransferase